MAKENSPVDSIKALIADDTDSDFSGDEGYKIVSLDRMMKECFRVFDDGTEKGLTAHYVYTFKHLDRMFTSAIDVFNKQCPQPCRPYCQKRYIFESTFEAFNDADDLYKKLLEMTVDASKMAAISQIHDYLTTRMSKLKELLEEHDSRAALHNSSE